MTKSEKDMLRTDAVVDQELASLKTFAEKYPSLWVEISRSLAKIMTDCEDGWDFGPLDEMPPEALYTVLQLAYYAHTRVTGLILGRDV